MSKFSASFLEKNSKELVYLTANKIEDILDTKYFDQIYGNLTPKLIISYKRYYFTLNKLRITFCGFLKYLVVRI